MPFIKKFAVYISVVQHLKTVSNLTHLAVINNALGTEQKLVRAVQSSSIEHVRCRMNHFVF
jgi:hypothetical protein